MELRYMEQLLIKQLVKVFNKGGGMMMNYEEPLLEIVFATDDVITTSPPGLVEGSDKTDIDGF